MMFRIVFFFALLFGQLAFGQSTGSIYGRITDGNDSREPLLFANVSLKDAKITAQTNFHGNFEITGVQPGSYHLEINYLGYEPGKVLIEVKSDEVTFVEASLQVMSMHTESLLLSEANTAAIKIVDKTAKD